MRGAALKAALKASMGSALLGSVDEQTKENSID